MSKIGYTEPKNTRLYAKTIFKYMVKHYLLGYSKDAMKASLEKLVSLMENFDSERLVSLKGLTDFEFDVIRLFSQYRNDNWTLDYLRPPLIVLITNLDDIYAKINERAKGV